MFVEFTIAHDIKYTGTQKLISSTYFVLIVLFCMKCSKRLKMK